MGEGENTSLGHCPLASCQLLLGALKITKLWLFRAIALCLTGTIKIKITTRLPITIRRERAVPDVQADVFKQSGELGN